MTLFICDEGTVLNLEEITILVPSHEEPYSKERIPARVCLGAHYIQISDADFARIKSALVLDALVYPVGQ